LESAKWAKADIDQVAMTNRDFMGTRPRPDRVPVACNHPKRPPGPARSRIATYADQNRTANSVLYLHTLARGNQIANPSQALETTYGIISKRGVSKRIGLGVLQAITPLKPSISRLGSCR